MKNLKKVLALVLVLATFATMASAASFTDEDAIVNVEAAAMLSDMGIIGGYPDGSFKPANAVTRGETAKMLYGFINHIG